MQLLIPGQGWAETSLRNPAGILVEAGPEIQAACLRAGGVNRFGRPNFRVVWAPRRFEMFGDFETCRRDAAGNVVPMGPQTLGMLKYRMPDGLEEGWVLERWFSPEYYGERGRHQREVVWDGPFASQRQLPPLPQFGDYEAIESGMGTPLVFVNRYTAVEVEPGRWRMWAPMTPFLVEAAIRLYRAGRMRSQAEKDADGARETDRKEQESDARYVDWAKEAMGPYAFKPHAGYGGKTREIGSTATTSI